jgi:Holliday junction resolvasome RuvABC DNA-binding subunit
MYRDAQMALVGLGYRDADAEAVLRKIRDQRESSDDTAPVKVEDLIRVALRQL